MMKKYLLITGIIAVATSGIFLFGCGKKEVVQGPTDAILTAVTLNDLIPGNFYVKSGNSFYLLPVEDCNYDMTKLATSTTNSDSGMIEELNRIADFVYKDMAIPTLYKNEQLIYVSDGSLSSFTWERFKDYGYSVGLSGLSLSDAGKVESKSSTMASSSSTIAASLSTMTIPGSTIIFDKINGTAIGSQYLNDGGIITGMSKDATANIDLYIGTQHVPLAASADTRYFKSFELYKTDKYTLSTEGYAILEIPSYFKSGYYMINNVGFVKFLNIDRGVDESGIDLNIAYYYTSNDGKIMTFYEWQEANGLLPAGSQQTSQAVESIDVEDYPERSRIVIDNTQQSLDVLIAYKYTNDEYRIDANKNGKFPKVLLLDPIGKFITLTENEGKTYGSNNIENYTYLSTTVDGLIAGEWYLLYNNFDNTQKIVYTDIHSGNATSYLHNGTNGNITIYYDETASAHDILITWENVDRAAKLIKITAPDGTIYSLEQTPGNIMANEFGKFVVKLPYLAAGNYRIDVSGDNLGRVWVDTQESVSLNTFETPGEDAEAPVEDQESKDVEVQQQ